MASDIFDDVLNLEEQYHQEGYENGYRDGAEAGRIEGRSVGMKQGYEKFVEAGRLQGRALVWANRIPRLRSPPPARERTSRSPTLASSSSTAPPPMSSATTHAQQQQPSSSPSSEESARMDADDRSRQGGEPTTTSGSSSSDKRRLPDLAPSNNARLEKNVATLYGMVEPGTLSTRNDDEAVNDFDSRLKGAQGKLKVIERVVAEKVTTDELEDHGRSTATATAAGGPKNSNIEDIGRIPKPPQPPPK